MMDEPLLGPEFHEPFTGPPEEEAKLVDGIRDLVGSQPFAVLCTQGGGQPYGSVVAFAVTRDLRSFMFATPRATRKYRLLSDCERVALVIDNRGQYPDDMMKVEAITVTGQARQVPPGPQFDAWGSLLTARHPYLRTFIKAPSTALFRVDVVRILHVTRFQEVRQWLPRANG
ncbi:MAG: pyridoxamine 5'-phosphate oxidase family protein [Anaerolineae bacterium]|jgi:hypothetical protein